MTRVVPESSGLRARLDLVGAALATLAATAVVLPLIEGREHGWPLWAWVSLGVAPVLVHAFVRYQRRAAAPLVDLGLFRDRAFALGSLIALTFALVPPAFFFVLALYLQQGRGYSALFSGTVFMAVGVGYFAALCLARLLTARLGHQVLAVGALLVAAGCLVLAEVVGTTWSLELVPGLALTGFGIGMVLVPLSSTVLAGINAQQAGSAAGVLSKAQQIGGALGVAVIGMVFFGTHPIADAFTASLWVLAGLTVLTAVLTQLLPSRASRQARVSVEESDVRTTG